MCNIVGENLIDLEKKVDELEVELENKRMSWQLPIIKSRNLDHSRGGKKQRMMAKSRQAKHFEAQHIIGEHRANKPVNDVANFDEVGYRM